MPWAKQTWCFMQNREKSGITVPLYPLKPRKIVLGQNHNLEEVQIISWDQRSPLGAFPKSHDRTTLVFSLWVVKLEVCTRTQCQPKPFGQSHFQNKVFRIYLS